MKRRMIAALAALAIGAAIAALGTGTAYATEPATFVVTPAGIVLEQPFVDGAHLNVRTDAGTVNLHAESKCAATPSPPECSPRMVIAAQLIGQTIIPWSAFGYVGCEGVLWAQAWYANYHFGEQGETPVTVAPCAPVVEPPVVEPPVVEEAPSVLASTGTALPLGGVASGVVALALGALLIARRRHT